MENTFKIKSKTSTFKQLMSLNFGTFEQHQRNLNNKKRFIQHFMDNNSDTFLEIGSIVTEEFDSIPTNFMVTSDNSIFITIPENKVNMIINKWGVSWTDIKTSLLWQFGKHINILKK